MADFLLFLFMDAPFCETIEEIRQYQSEGVKTAETESAGLLTVG